MMTYFIWTIPVGIFMVIVGPLAGAWWIAAVGVVVIAVSIGAAIWGYRAKDY